MISISQALYSSSTWERGEGEERGEKRWEEKVEIEARERESKREDRRRESGDSGKEGRIEESDMRARSWAGLWRQMAIS